MKIAVVGGGPAGLYFAYLVKKAHRQASVTVYERNSREATYGFGVVLADGGLQNLKEADLESYEEIIANTETLAEQVIAHPDAAVVIDSQPRAGSISRLRLLQILQSCCEKAGVQLKFGVEIRSPEEVSDATLVVAADGVNSGVRAGLADTFGTTSYTLNNRFAWYGVERPYTAPTLSFKRYGDAALVAHYYRYSPTMSTFVVECDTATWLSLGMADMTDEERRQLSERVFAQELQGAPLIANNSLWRQFQVVHNETWGAGNVVLLGDAQRSMHFSIGSGTRMAMEDAVALRQAIGSDAASTDVVLKRFEQLRRPAVRAFWQAALRSIQWYEVFGEKLRLPPIAFAYDYMMRTGRMTEKRLRANHPAFMKQYESYRGER